MRTKIALGVVMLGLFLAIGTVGAMETDSITTMQFTIRCLWIMPMTAVALYVFKRGVRDDGEEGL